MSASCDNLMNQPVNADTDWWECKVEGHHPVNIAAPNPNPLPARAKDCPVEVYTESDFPENALFFIVRRKEGETDEAWAKRCAVVRNVGAE